MAAYASTTTFVVDSARKIDMVLGIGILVGTLNITNYNATTQPELTDITGKFKSILSVTFSASDKGHGFECDLASGKVQVWAGTTEAVTDVDAGQANFIVIGLI